MDKKMGCFIKFLCFRADMVLIFILILVTLGGIKYFSEYLPASITANIRQLTIDNELNKEEIQLLKKRMDKVMPAAYKGRR